MGWVKSNPHYIHRYQWMNRRFISCSGEHLPTQSPSMTLTLSTDSDPKHDPNPENDDMPKPQPGAGAVWDDFWPLPLELITWTTPNTSIIEARPTGTISIEVNFCLWCRIQLLGRFRRNAPCWNWKSPYGWELFTLNCHRTSPSLCLTPARVSSVPQTRLRATEAKGD
jgi:hypothetical protein